MNVQQQAKKTGITQATLTTAHLQLVRQASCVVPNDRHNNATDILEP
jgi:hypothetical protein